MKEMFKEVVTDRVIADHIGDLINNKDYQDFILDLVSYNLGKSAMDILKCEKEIILKLSPLQITDDPDTCDREYRQEFEWVPLVTCKNCTRRLICYHSDNYYCADGERRE